MKIFEIIRPILFYCRSESVTMGQLKQFYTDRAIEDFITFGFIEEKQQ